MRRRCGSHAAPICPGIDSFTYLSRLRGRAQTHPRPAELDALMAARPGHRRIAEDGDGDSLQSQLAETGCNYVVGQFAFGDLTRDECLRSIELFADEVMPALRANVDVPGRCSAKR